jgi:hypothetical protein
MLKCFYIPGFVSFYKLRKYFLLIVLTVNINPVYSSQDLFNSLLEEVSNTLYPEINFHCTNPQECKALIKKDLGVRPKESVINKLIKDELKFKNSEYSFHRLIYVNTIGEEQVSFIAIPHVKQIKGIAIAMHQTTDMGYKEPMGFEGYEELAYGKLYLKAGFIVIVSDTFSTNERSNPNQYWKTKLFYKKFPNWTAFDRMLYDHQQSLTVSLAFLSKLKLNKNYPVIALGHSLGGHNALMMGLFDDRVSRVISSCGFERIDTDSNRTRWSRANNDLFIYTRDL